VREGAGVIDDPIGQVVAWPWDDGEPLFREFRPYQGHRTMVVYRTIPIAWPGVLHSDGVPAITTMTDARVVERTWWRWIDTYIAIYATRGDRRAEGAMAMLVLALHLFDFLAKVTKP
jgi:hypothetical protein